MKIVDANIVLRYLLNDTDDLSERASELLENNIVLVPNEVIAEIVYVLEKVYKIDNYKISNTLNELFDYRNIQVIDKEVLKVSLELYGMQKLDFVDTLLYAYSKVHKHEVYTFDKKLYKLLQSGM